MLTSNKEKIPQWEKFYFKKGKFEAMLKELTTFNKLVENKQFEIQLNNKNNNAIYEKIDKGYILYIQNLISNLTKYDYDLHIEIDCISFFINEYHNFYSIRIKQIRRHLHYLKKAIEQNKLRFKAKAKPEAKDAPYANVYTFDELDSINDTLEDLNESLLEENIHNQNKVVFYDTERLTEYLNIYELVIKELHKECSYLLKFLHDNIHTFNEISKLYNKSISSLIFKINLLTSKPNEELKESLADLKTHFYNLIKETGEKQILNNFIHALEKTKDEIETLFEEKFKQKYDNDPELALEVLQSNSDLTNFSSFQIFTFGFLLGCLLLIVIAEEENGTSK